MMDIEGRSFQAGPARKKVGEGGTAHAAAIDAAFVATNDHSPQLNPGATGRGDEESAMRSPSNLTIWRKWRTIP
jgi:hypothetical protein